MKSIIFLICAVLVTVSSVSVFALKDPAAVYCRELGYEWGIEITAKGNERGICILPDGQRVDEWDFLEGTAALNWSYCSVKGYGAKNVKNSEICGVCTPKICGDCTVCTLPDGTEAEVTELMGLSFEETTCGDGTCGIPESFKTCPQDCPSAGEDMYCDGASDGLCDPDCTPEADPDCEEARLCGDGVCDANENFKNCPDDCPSGGKDNYCDGVKDGKCDPDCSAEEDIDCKKPGFDMKLLLIIAGVIILILIVIIFIVRRK